MDFHDHPAFRLPPHLPGGLSKSREFHFPTPPVYAWIASQSTEGNRANTRQTADATHMTDRGKCTGKSERSPTGQKTEWRANHWPWEDGITPQDSEILPRMWGTVYSRNAGQFDSPLAHSTSPFINPTLSPLHPSAKLLMTAKSTVTRQSNGKTSAEWPYNPHDKSRRKIDVHHAVSVPPSLLHLTNLTATHLATQKYAVLCYRCLYSRFRRHLRKCLPQRQ